jgi:hypothetical protein
MTNLNWINNKGSINTKEAIKIKSFNWVSVISS